jgi:hypothetical protein
MLKLDILSALSGVDFLCKTAMSRREDVLSCIDATIMDRTVGFYQARAELLQEIFPPIRDLGVNCPGALFVSRPLRSSKLKFQVAVEAFCLDRWQACVAKGRELSQAEVNADAWNRSIQDQFHRNPLPLARADSRRSPRASLPSDTAKNRIRTKIAVHGRTPCSKVRYSNQHRIDLAG